MKKELLELFDRFVEVKPGQDEEGHTEWLAEGEDFIQKLMDSYNISEIDESTDIYLCKSTYNDENRIQDCTCGKCR